MHGITKARTWTDDPRPPAAERTPPLFHPPPSGGMFYSQGYRWQQVLHFKFWSFVAIRAWMQEIAGGQPPNLGRITGRKPASKRGRPRTKALGGPQEHEEFEPYPPDHPLQRLFANPNGPDVAYDLWAFHTLFLKLTGSAHWWILKNQFQVPVEIWVIPTQWMRLETGRDGGPVSWYVQSPWGPALRIPYGDVVSFYEHSPLNRFEGYAVNQAIAEWLDTYDSLVRTRLATFKNGAVPAFHVLLGEGTADPDEAMLNRYYAKWFARFQGENRVGQPLITGPGMEVKPLGMAPTEMGFEASEDQLRDMTLTAYGVPRAVIGLDPLNDTSAYAPQRQFCRFSINPALTYMGQVLTEKIVKPVDPEGVCYWDSRVVDDPAQLLNEVAARRAGFSITPNEERTLFGAAPYDYGGDDPVLPDGTVLPWATGKSPDPDLDSAMDRLLGRGRPAPPAEGRDFGDQAPPPAGANGNGRKVEGLP